MTKLILKDDTITLGWHNARLVELKFGDVSQCSLQQVLSFLQEQLMPIMLL